MAAAPIFPGTIVNASYGVVPADTTTTKTVYTAPAGGARIDKIIAASNDTAAHDMQIFVSGNLIGTVSVPIGAGNTSAASAKDVLADSNIAAPIDPYGNKVIYLSNGQTLQVAMAVTVTAAKQVTVTAMGGSF